VPMVRFAVVVVLPAMLLVISYTSANYEGKQ
jgi:hypothetical protein